MIAGAPRRKARGEASIRPWRTGTRSGRRDRASSARSATGSTPAGRGGSSACAERGTSARSARPQAARSSGVASGTPGSLPRRVFPLKDNIPTERTPWVTIALIAVNVVVFLLELRGGGTLGSGPDATESVRWGFIPYELTHPGRHCGLTPAGAVLCQGQDGVRVVGSQPATAVTLFSAMFMHGGVVHLGGNMLFLWIFGNNVEDAMGRPRFVAFYLLGGLAATALQTAIGPDSTVPNIGASGAIAAVLGGYLVLYPRARVLTLVFLIVFFAFIQLPALLFLVIWFAQQVLFGLAGFTDPTGGGGVAYFAHIGGFVFGALAIRAFATRVKPGFGRDDPGPRHPVY